MSPSRPAAPAKSSGTTGSAEHPGRRMLDGVNTAALVVSRVTVVIWAAFEVGLSIRDRRRGMGGTGRDRGTRQLIATLIPLSALASALVAAKVPAPGLPPGTGMVVLGTVVMWIGLASRAWAVVSLGQAFRTTVEVDDDQGVVTRGPYRWVRHPSYTGLLLVIAGLGLSLASWLGLLICTVVPGLAILRRIRVEEEELARVLGEPYRAYRRRTRRLVPGLW